MDPELVNTLTLSLMEKATSYQRWIFEEIQPYVRGNVLEVGCGIGNLTGFLLNHGKVIVSDIHQSYLQTIQDKYRGHPNLKGVFLWNIEQNPAPKFNVSIDTILCSNVLEHIENEEAALHAFYQVLSDRGRLIILVPALKRLYNALDKELGHFRRYHKAELAQKLTQGGFKICSLTFFNMFGIVGWFINGTLFKRRLLSATQLKMFDKMVPLFIWIGKIIPPKVGQSLIIVGEKG